ncbi:DUF308 domain-containing protein [Caballeronia sp. LP006]|uniref:HdeD family acid-resistance protein n=1 Tax=unclassified Caballeronia TaxID=2646786 RepID=UPI00285CB4DF|nr:MULTISPECIES: DUF308 domain-containing protein [unclassified Caballeronia]MDR5805929.1 DUF308 domain-containing protein [Caballeronia sp. LZ001]MDR5826382.1 DUF308 domain-containing protein [Caballeronia sp. LP006]
MVKLMMILLGVDYLRGRWRSLMVTGWLLLVVGLGIFIDALDGSLGFPIPLVGWLLLIEGALTLAVAWAGVGGQRRLRYSKGIVFVLAAVLVLQGPRHHANFILSLFIGAAFLSDGLLQAASAVVVRYRRWRVALGFAIFEILLAVFVIQPYPTHYKSTVVYCVGVLFMFAGWNLVMIASRVRKLNSNPAVWGDASAEAASAASDTKDGTPVVLPASEWDGPPADNEPALTVHVWTPVGTSKGEVQRYLIVDRYIAAVDRNGVISTGHAALESPEGVYVSLYPAVEIDRSPDDFARLLRATSDNDVPGVFQPSYPIESKTWCPSTTRVRIRNYDPTRLARFWSTYREDTTYNLTHRNCSSSVSRALEAALEGAAGRLYGARAGWGALFRMLVTPELWVAAQIRKRAVTMAWTPGLTLDYARALSMVADPRPYGWLKVARMAIAKMRQSRRQWRHEGSSSMDPPANA